MRTDSAVTAVAGLGRAKSQGACQHREQRLSQNGLAGSHLIYVCFWSAAWTVHVMLYRNPFDCWQDV